MSKIIDQFYLENRTNINRIKIIFNDSMHNSMININIIKEDNKYHIITLNNDTINDFYIDYDEFINELVVYKVEEWKKTYKIPRGFKLVADYKWCTTIYYDSTNRYTRFRGTNYHPLGFHFLLSLCKVETYYHHDLKYRKDSLVIENIREQKLNSITNIKFSIMTQLGKETFDIDVNIKNDNYNRIIHNYDDNITTIVKYDYDGNVVAEGKMHTILFLAQLNSLNIDDWKEFYRPKGIKRTDMPAWYLELSYSKFEPLVIRGEGVFPTGIKKLIKILEVENNHIIHNNRYNPNSLKGTFSALTYVDSLLHNNKISVQTQITLLTLTSLLIGETKAELEWFLIIHPNFYIKKSFRQFVNIINGTNNNERYHNFLFNNSEFITKRTDNDCFFDLDFNKFTDYSSEIEETLIRVIPLGIFNYDYIKIVDTIELIEDNIKYTNASIVVITTGVFWGLLSKMIMSLKIACNKDIIKYLVGEVIQIIFLYYYDKKYVVKLRSNWFEIENNIDKLDGLFYINKLKDKHYNNIYKILYFLINYCDNFKLGVEESLKVLAKHEVIILATMLGMCNGYDKIKDYINEFEFKDITMEIIDDFINGFKLDYDNLHIDDKWVSKYLDFTYNYKL